MFTQKPRNKNCIIIFLLLSFHFISTTRALYLIAKTLCIHIFLWLPLCVRCAMCIHISRCIFVWSVRSVDLVTNVHIFQNLLHGIMVWYLVWCFLPYHDTHPLNEVIVFVDFCILYMQRYRNAKLFGFNHLPCSFHSVK